MTQEPVAFDATSSSSQSNQSCSPVTQLDFARAGIITDAMRTVAEKEQRTPEEIRDGVACGRIAIPANIHHTTLSPEGVGTVSDGCALRTKVNVNLGVSSDIADEAEEWKKVDIALKYGADAIMDLSNTGKTQPFRCALIGRSPVMIGTVPMYDAIGYLEKGLIDITAEDFLRVVRQHVEDGVDFVTIHAGMNRRVIDSFKETGRLTNIVSRGGSLIYAWMEATGNENPFYEYYDEVLSILHAHDVTISIGDAMRPGSTYDASDASQIAELIEIGKLTRRAWDAGVQVMVEGPGHMALDEIAANMKMERRLCHNAPFYVLGPLVSDIAPGYDHITAAIGGALAAASGAGFLCYVTPAEHLRLPDADDVREGLIATKIAAHAADMVKGVPSSRERDNRMSDARRRVDWEEMFSLALDPDRARAYFESAPPTEEGTCTMCGDMCAMKLFAEFANTGFKPEFESDIGGTSTQADFKPEPGEQNQKPELGELRSEASQPSLRSPSSDGADVANFLSDNESEEGQGAPDCGERPTKHTTVCEEGLEPQDGVPCNSAASMSSAVASATAEHQTQPSLHPLRCRRNINAIRARL